MFFSITIPAYSTENGGIASLRQTGRAFASVAKKDSPSVVFIKVESTRKGAEIQSPFGNDLLRRFFGNQFPGYQDQQRAQPEQHVVAEGSGFVYKVDKGLLKNKTYILTNNHVVENADKIHITFQDGDEFDAKVVGADPKSDIAVVEINDASHKPLTMGDSSALEVGEWVIALGNPFGLSHTLTVGVVSAKGRSGLGINDYEDFIQTDAAINPGNSGGPLLNLDGQVVGINTAIFSKSGGYMGVGFAIPVNLATKIAQQLIDKGHVTRGYLGVVIQSLTQELAQSFGLKENKGILVAQVTDNSPAKRAGIKAGDLIIRYQNKPVDDVAEFRNQVALTEPGTDSELTVIRDGKDKILHVKIGKLDDAKLVARDGSVKADELGITVESITPDLADKYDIEAGKGVLISEVRPNSIAAMSGLRPGTIILEVNREKVNSIREFSKALQKSQSDKRVLLLVSNGGMSSYVVLKW